jgi:hypothetical protein
LQKATDGADQWREREVWFPSEFFCATRFRLKIPGDTQIEALCLHRPVELCVTSSRAHEMDEMRRS